MSFNVRRYLIQLSMKKKIYAENRIQSLNFKPETNKIKFGNNVNKKWDFNQLWKSRCDSILFIVIRIFECHQLSSRVADLLKV